MYFLLSIFVSGQYLVLRYSSRVTASLYQIYMHVLFRCFCLYVIFIATFFLWMYFCGSHNFLTLPFCHSQVMLPAYISCTVHFAFLSYPALFSPSPNILLYTNLSILILSFLFCLPLPSFSIQNLSKHKDLNLIISPNICLQ